MNDILTNPSFRAAYAKMAQVSLNPHRHTASNALEHSEAVVRRVRLLALANGCTAAELAFLTDLGHAHDIGKITGSARPSYSVEVLRECGVSDERFLAFVKWHDTSLPWHKAFMRGQAPSERAWRRLAEAVELRLLCLFMVADRVDCPGGWRENEPTEWFLFEARSRGYIDELVLDDALADDQPSSSPSM